jgi:peptidoglycan/LPS O-acetylase OafA/YrhL
MTFSIIVPVHYNELNLPDTIPHLLGLSEQLTDYHVVETGRFTFKKANNYFKLENKGGFGEYVVSEKEKTYFPELDGLRFFAFLLVFIHHSEVISSNPYWLALRDYGWMGVDLFLCLSAFLFTKLLYTEYQRTGTINIPYFYVRRTLRIWPLYYVVTFALILQTVSQLGSSGLAWRTIGMLTFTDNLLTAAFLTYNPFLYASHLWTIAYEEQFYAVIP